MLVHVFWIVHHFHHGTDDVDHAKVASVTERYILKFVIPLGQYKPAHTVLQEKYPIYFVVLVVNLAVFGLENRPQLRAEPGNLFVFQICEAGDLVLGAFVDVF